MQVREPGCQDHRFVIGLVAGAVVGAGVTMWLIPRVRKASARVSETAAALGRKGRRVRDDVAGAVARGAHEVERYATAARTDRLADVRPPPTAGD